MKVLLHETDEEHSITLQELVEKLAEYNVTAERKSLYSDRIQLAGPEDVVEKMKAHVKKQCEMYGV